MFSGALDPLTNAFLNGIEDQVARDSEDQYNIAKAQGDSVQVCVQAGFVSAAFLQEKDTPNYNRWKAI